MKLYCAVALAVSITLTGCGGWGEDPAPDTQGTGQSGSTAASNGSNGSLPISYAGRIDGQHADGLVLTDGVNDLTVTPEDRSFQFPSSGASGGGALSVKLQPSNPSEICTVTGTGVTDAVVSCVYKERFVYAAVPSTGEVRQFAIDSSSGQLTFVRTVAWGAPGANDDADVASIVMHPFRNFLYVVSEQLAQITVYAVDPSNGYLTQSGAAFDVPGDGVPGSGAWEKDLGFSPDGSHAYSLDADNAVLNHYRVDASTGQLSLSEQTPVSIRNSYEPNFAVDPLGKWAYLIAAIRTGSRMTSFPINSDGSLGAAVETTPPSRATLSGIDAARKLAYVIVQPGENRWALVPFSIRPDGTYAASATTPAAGWPFRIDPYADLLVQWVGSASATLNSYKITDPVAGLLQATGFMAATPYAANAFFTPDGKYVIVTATDVTAPSKVFSIGADGSFTPVAGAPTQFTEIPAAAFGYY